MSKPNLDIKMSFAVRLSAMGMLGLASLNSTQWARENISSTNTLFQFFLGVSPNIAAGYAMPLILASFIEKVIKNENKSVFQNKNHPTKRTPDAGDSAAFSSIFLASSFSRSQTESTPAPAPVR